MAIAPLAQTSRPLAKTVGTLRYTESMNMNKNLATVCSWYPGKRPASSLVPGVGFTFKGEQATFLRWNGPAYAGRHGVMRGAVVATEGNPNRVWMLNMAGSVGIV